MAPEREGLKSERLNIAVTESFLNELRGLAAENGQSVSSTVRDGLRVGLYIMKQLQEGATVYIKDAESSEPKEVIFVGIAGQQIQ